MVLTVQDILSMKSYRNLYQTVCSWENLVLAWKKARKGKTRKRYVKKFERDLEKNLLDLQFELKNQFLQVYYAHLQDFFSKHSE